jgi:DNA-binding beta-propeller fold protein YncE
VCLCTLLAATGSWAELSEPDHIIYGSASLYGEPLAEGTLVSLMLDGGANPVARHVVSPDSPSGDLYVLRVPLDSVGARLAGTARVGDEATILIDEEIAGLVTVGERGTVQVMDVDPQNVEATPSLSIDDVAVVEGDAGAAELVFTVTLSPISEDEVTASWITGDGTAAGGPSCGPGVDYAADSGMITIAPGDETAMISVMACGDLDPEDDEVFYVDLLDPVDAVLLDPQGRGTIADDDTPPRLSVNNVTVTEPPSGMASTFFRVSMSRLWDQEVSFGFATSNGTAVAGLDYHSTSGTGTIPVGSLETTIEVEVLADTLNEADETFFVTLSNPVNSSILDGEGQGIIVDAAQFLIWLEAQVDGASAVDGLAGAYASAVSPDGSHLYVTGSAENAIAVFDRDPVTGALSFNRVYTPADFMSRETTDFVGLTSPQAVVVSEDGLNVYVAAFADDAVSVFERNPADGSLSLLEVEINGANDIGDPGAAVAGLDGPTSLALSPTDPDGQHLYAAGFISNSVAVFERQADGRISFLETEVDGVDDPTDLGGMVDGLHLASGIAVSPDGANVYVAAQGDNAVAVFERDTDPGSGTIGTLSFMAVERDNAGGVDGLAAATGLALSGDGNHLYVAGQSDNAIAVFQRESSGALTWTGMVAHGVDDVDGLLGASSVAVSMDDRYIYAGGYLSNAAAVFERDIDDMGPSFGALSFIEVKSDGVGGVDGLFRPTSLAVSPDDANVYVTGYGDNAVAVFYRDLTAPTDPAVTSTDHDIGVWSNNPVIAMSWSGAGDDPGGSGVAGYSFLFDTVETTQPDAVQDLMHTVDPHTASSAAVADGMDHWYHLRTCDHSDNCSTGVHAGPYWIDTVPPDAVAILSSSHEVGVPSFDDTIQMWWADPTPDPGTVASGTFGYSYTFNTNPVGQCNFEVDATVGTGNATSVSLPAGLWYFHICAVDNAGNWSAPATAGPYELINDTIPPKIIDLGSVAQPEPGRPSLGLVETHGITQLLLVFSKQMYDPADNTDPNDVSNPANYLLVNAGPDSVHDTTSCTVGGDDVTVSIAGAVYNSSTSTTALAVGNGMSLPLGRYRLFACADNSLQDINGNPLDGNGDGTGGDDYAFTFLMGRTNVVTNPNLDDQNLAPEWTLSNPARTSFSTDDAADAETSGSVRIHREQGVGDDQEFSVSQCVALPAWDGSDFHLSAAARVNETLGGDPGVAGAFAGVTYYDAPNCAGSAIGPEHPTDVVLDDTLGQWVPVAADLGPSPAAAQSALVSLTVQIPLGEDFPFDVWFDNVALQAADSVPPSDPLAVPTTHVLNGWTSANVIEVSWDGVTDSGIGVAGYSYVFDTLPGTVPDDVVDLPHTGGVHTASSGVVADGQWYFHIRACDHMDNCTDAVHTGWLGIDTVAPNAPTGVVSTTHTTGVPSPDNVIAMSWTAAVDNPPVPSGVIGYAAQLTDSAMPDCGAAMTAGTGDTTFTSEPLANGEWYFHICSVDQAANRSAVATAGPLTVADTTPPRVLSVGSVAALDDGSLDQADVTDVAITRLLVDFSEYVHDPPGDSDPGDVTNPNNYILVTGGVDGIITTGNCNAIQGDDQNVPITGVLFDAAARQAAVSLGGSSLPQERYRFFICSTGAIRDPGGNFLDGDGNGTGGDDFAEDFRITGTNLLVNPNFDEDLDSWETTTVPPSDFEPADDDADGAIFSGSALMVNDSGMDVTHELSQCTAVPAFDGVLQLEGVVRLTKLGAADPMALAGATFFDGPGCTGAVLRVTGSTAIIGDTGGIWEPIEMQLGAPPPGTVSIRTSFFTMVASVAPAEFEANIDNTALRMVDVLYADGFESGDTTGWDDVQP